MNILTIITIALCALLSACTSDVYPTEVEAANRACEPFGRWLRFEGDVSNYSPGDEYITVTAVCSDGTRVSFTLHNKLEVK